MIISGLNPDLGGSEDASEGSHMAGAETGERGVNLESRKSSWWLPRAPGISQEALLWFYICGNQQ